MNELKFSEAAGLSEGLLSGGSADAGFTCVCTDTRKIEKGCLFIALRGERFDAHDFVPQAIEQGAAGVLLSKNDSFSLPPQIARIQVADTLIAMQKIAEGYRAKLPVRTVAITGSNGKTSTKECVAAILSKKYKTHKTQGNLNNHIGVPLTIFQMDKTHEYGVVEMGMNHPGELAPLMQIARPMAGIVSNVGPVHIENFENEEAIAVEKSTVVSCLNADGYSILNGDDRWIDLLREKAKGKILTFGTRSSEVDFQAFDIRTADQGMHFIIRHKDEEYPAWIPVFGEHMVYNALSAAALGRTLGLSWEVICSGLSKVKLPGMRMQQIQINGVNVINDAYNANPISVEAGLKTLKTMAGNHSSFAVLGDMFELGEMSDEAHCESGKQAARLNFSGVLALGDQAEQIVRGARAGGMREDKVFVGQGAQQIAEELERRCHPGDWVLIKGSRGAKMEEVVAAWQQLG